MEDAAKLTENQLNFTDALEPDDVLSAKASSRHWPEIASRLDILTKEIAVALAANAAYLYILDEKRRLLRPYFSWPVRTSKTYFTEQAVGAGIAGLAAQSKRPVRVKKPKNKKLTQPDWPHQSALAVPLALASAEQPVGVLVVADKIDQLAFSPQDEQLLLSLVNQTDAALTIKNANLVHRKRDRGQELTILSQISQTLNNSLHLMDVDSVCQAILEIPDLKDIFQFDVAEICLWNPQAKILTTALRMVDGSPDVQAFARTYHLNEGYTGWIAAHQKSLLIEDTQRYTETTPRAGLANFPYRSYLGVPLKIGAKLLGTLELVAAPIAAYENTDVTVLEIVANHAAMAIDHARLFQETQSNLSKLSLLFDASYELSSTRSYEELLADLSSQMAEAFSADKCVVYNFDEASGSLTLVQQYLKSTPNNNHQPPLEQETLPLTVSKFPALQTALKERSLLIVRLGDNESAPYETEWLKQQDCGAMVAIPLIGRDKVTGLVQLFSTNPKAFTEDEIWLAQSLASQVNIAIENALLFNLTDQQLQTRVNELAGLQRVSGELNSTLDLNRILDIVLEEAIRVTRADFGNVNLYDVQTGTLVAYKEQGWPDHAHEGDKSNSRTAAATRGIMGRALKSGQAILVPDVSKDKDYINLGGDTCSKVVVPIFYGGEPAGVINLESKYLNFFNNDQLRYLEALANQAAVAMGNTQAYQEQKRERERANRRADQLARLSEISNAFRTNRPLVQILEDVAYAIAETVGYSVVLVSLIEGNPPMIWPKVGAGIPLAQLETLQHEAQQPLSNLQTVMLEEFRISNSYFIPVERMEVWQSKLDVPQVEQSHPHNYLLSENEGLILGAAATKHNAWRTGDVLFIPLTDTEDNTIGLLTVANPDVDERPDILHVQTLEIFANHAAAAIENARLFELEQQRRRLADTLRGVAETISSQLDFEELLNIVLQELAKVIDYDSASVQLLKEDQLVIIGGRGWEDSQQVIGTTFSMEGKNPNRRVIETQEPFIVSNAPLAYPEAFSRPPHDRVRSWLGVPLTYGINVLGLMVVESYARSNAFTQEDAKVVLAFASQVAVALQNARLFEEARQQVRQLAALTQVAQSINRALNLNEVLNLVLDAVFDLVGQSKGSIWLIDHAGHTVKIADTKNIPNFLVELFNKSAISVDSEPFASVIQSGQVLVIEGTSGKDDIAHYGLPFPDDVTYVPLKTEAGVIGILAIELVIHNKNMLKLVTTLADLAAVAIDNARLLEDTRRRANEMQNLYRLGVEVSGLLDVRQVMGSVVNNALTLTDTQIGTILLWDEEARSYLIDGALNTDDAVAQLVLNEAKESFELDPSAEGEELLWSRLTQQIIDTGQPIVLGTPAAVVSEPLAAGQGASVIASLRPTNGYSKPALPLGVRAILGAPIQVQNEVSGAIFVCNLAARNFNERDIQLLSFVANQAAVAVRNAQLVQRLNLLTEELERRVAQRTEELAQTLQDLTEERDRVNALYQITRELAASFDLDRVLVEALSLINRAVGISHGSILLLDHETGNLVYRAALGRDKPLPRGGHKTQYRPGYGLAGKVIETRQARIVPDLFMDPDWVAVEETPDRRSALVVPLITGEDVLGVLLLFHPELDYFTEDHLKLVIAAGAQVATAINNAELYRLITDQAQRLGVMLRTQAAEAAKNQAILKGITDGVLVLDARRNIVLVNPKAAKILNVEAERLENQPIQQSLGQPGSGEQPEFPYLFYLQLLKALAALEAGESSAEFRVEAGNKVVTVTLAPVTLAPEEQPSLLAVLRDISREAEIDRIKNEFISTVSHELRTPMTSIKGYADLLVSGSPQVGELNSIQRRFVQIIQSNANRLTELVNDILEISRIETGRVKLELESLDIIQIINEVAVSFEGQMANKALNLSLNLPEKLPNVYADKARVTQILVNLIGNAWQYTPEGGNIIIHAKVADHHFIQIDVEDTGIGIVEKDIQYVFDRFFRSERTEVQVVDGTGLGLSITRMFVEMLGGKIWLKSQLDVGTTFSFTLPMDATQVQIEMPFDEAGIQALPDLLLIDDNVIVANLLKPQLERAGYQVVIATEGENALNLVRQAQSSLKLIMLNLLLKNSDGFALLERLQQEEATQETPILLTSLGVDDSGQDLVVEVVDYISSSCADIRVLERVRWALTLATGETQEIGPVGMSSLRNGRYQMLVVAHNESTVKRLKEALEAHGYKVQRAFNSQQALDIASGDKPDLVLIDPKLPDVEGGNVISLLRRIAAPKRLPVIGIVDRPGPLQENNDKIKMLGRENWTKMRHPFVTDVLVAEIVQIGGKAGPSQNQKPVKI
jgi:GAF domain-containing protein/DNA-binding response OmpR family regulator